MKRIPKPTLQPGGGLADLEFVDNTTEAEIEAMAIEDDTLYSEEFYKNAVRRYDLESKTPISIRLDADVYNWFRSQGPGFQTRINAVLRDYVAEIRQREQGSAAR